MPNPFYSDKQFYFKQYILAWLHSLIIKNISIFKLFGLVKQLHFKQFSMVFVHTQLN